MKPYLYRRHGRWWVCSPTGNRFQYASCTTFALACKVARGIYS